MSLDTAQGQNVPAARSWGPPHSRTVLVAQSDACAKASLCGACGLDTCCGLLEGAAWRPCVVQRVHRYGLLCVP